MKTMLQNLNNNHKGRGEMGREERNSTRRVGS